MSMTSEQIERQAAYKRRQADLQKARRATPEGREYHRLAQARYRKTEKGQATTKTYRERIRAEIAGYRAMAESIKRSEQHD